VSEIIVLDNVIPEDAQDKLWDMMQDYRFSWHYGPSNIYEDENNNDHRQNGQKNRTYKKNQANVESQINGPKPPGLLEQSIEPFHRMPSMAPIAASRSAIRS
jgi:hypothetical protein